MHDDDREPFQDKLKRELEESEWLQKFRSMGHSLVALKAEVPLSQLCDLKWDTETDSLLMRCPNVEVWQGLQSKVTDIRAVNIAATRVVIQLDGQSDIVV